MSRSESPNQISNQARIVAKLDKALLAYAAAAGAAGIGMLVSPPASEAKIVYTAAHQVIGRNGRYQLDLNHDRLPDFTLINTYQCNTDFCVDALSAIPVAGNGVEGRRGFLSIPYASALKRGAPIGPKQVFSGQFMASSDSSEGTIGRWLNVTNGYLGLKFKIHGKTHYGWARLTVQVLHQARIRTTLTGYAYETIPNKPIIAGRIKNTEDIGSALQPLPSGLSFPVRELDSLGMLALGSPALPIWRRREPVLS